MPSVETLLSFIDRSPQDPFARYALALEYKGAGRLDEAWATFQALMELSPDYVAAYIHAGNTLVDLGRVDEAREVYSRGIEACARKGDLHARSQLDGALAAATRP